MWIRGFHSAKSQLTNMISVVSVIDALTPHSV